MWEAKAAAGRGGDLQAWALAHAPREGEVYASADGRVVVVAPVPLALPDVPAELVEQAPHAWDFTRIRRPGDPV